MAEYTDKEKHGTAIADLKKLQEAELEQREQANECDEFVLLPDGQWDPRVKEEIQSNKRPVMTFDLVSVGIEAKMSEIENMEFGINIKSIGSGANADGAKLREGMIRTIEARSHAPEIYRNAVRRLIRRGFDAWRVRARYEDEWSFDQDLFVEDIPNATNRVWHDGLDENGEDASNSFVLTSILLDTYKDKYPDGSGISVDDGQLNSRIDNYEPEVVTVAEHYYKKATKIEVAQLTNGEVVELNDKWEMIKDEYAAKGITIVKTKKAIDYRWYHRVMDGKGYLTKESETPFKSNPIITVHGNYELIGTNSKKLYFGDVLKQMDAQRTLNYTKSRTVEEVALSPKPKLLMTKQQAAGNEKHIATMNTDNRGALFYTHVEGQEAPYYPTMPQMSPALVNLGVEMQGMINAVGNINDAMLGKFAGRQSEDVIKQQVDRGVGATRKWVNAVVRGIKRTGDVLLESMPIVYDTNKVIILTGEDGEEKESYLNHEEFDAQTQKLVKVNDLNNGKYKCVAAAGASFTNKLEAGLQALLEYAAIDPRIPQLGGDIMLKSINAPMVEEVADRLRAQMLQQGMILPEQMTDKEKEQMQAQAQQPKEPDADMVNAQANLAAAQAKLMEQQNREHDNSIQVAKLQEDSQHQNNKLESETQLNIAKIRQQQQVIDDKKQMDMITRAIEMAKAEFEFGRDMNAAVNDNMLVFDPETGEFA